MIEFKNVKIGYDSPLAQIYFDTLHSGSIYALIGSNGSGKSTFLKTICGKEKALEGSIFIDNKNIQEFSMLELAKQIAFVPARFPEIDFMTVFDFIALGRTPYINNFGRLNQNDNSIIKTIIDKLHITHLENKFTYQLSDGEKQLCSIARALTQQTPILLLDEPTSFLDYRNKRRLLHTLYTLSQEMNLVILFSTHDLESIQQFDIQKIGIEANSKDRKIEMVSKSLDLDSIVNKYYH